MSEKGGAMSEPKIFTVNGELVELPKSNEVFLAMFRKNCGWHISGVIYLSPDQIEENLYNFHPETIIIVKVQIPKEA